MPEIAKIKPEQIAIVKEVIYRIAYDIFPRHGSLEETIAYYEERHTLNDLDHFEEHYVQRDGVFLVTMEDDTVIGSGALRRWQEGIGELKRIWFLPEYQGRGLGYKMIQTLLELARQQGYAKVRLETDPVYQQRALSLYQRIGFRQIPSYSPNFEDIAMELDLHAQADPQERSNAHDK